MRIINKDNICWTSFEFIMKPIDVYIYIHQVIRKLSRIFSTMSAPGQYGPPPPPPPNFWDFSGMQKKGGGLDPTKPLIGVGENVHIG